MPDCYTCGGNAFCDCIRMPNGEKVANPYWNSPVSGPNIQSVSFPAPPSSPFPPSSEIKLLLSVEVNRELQGNQVSISTKGMTTEQEKLVKEILQEEMQKLFDERGGSGKLIFI